jgi:hypothetical protein
MAGGNGFGGSDLFAVCEDGREKIVYAGFYLYVWLQRGA